MTTVVSCCRCCSRSDCWHSMWHLTTSSCCCRRSCSGHRCTCTNAVAELLWWRGEGASARGRRPWSWQRAGVVEADGHRRHELRRSVEPAAPEVVGNDHIGDSVEHELDIVGICCTGLMAIDLLCRAFVLGLELSLDVCCCFLVRLFACNKKGSCLERQKPTKLTDWPRILPRTLIDRLCILNVFDIVGHNNQRFLTQTRILQWMAKRQRIKVSVFVTVVCAHLYTRGNIWWEGTSWSSPRTDPSCWERGWWRCLWTTCCCRWSRTVSSSPACDSATGKRCLDWTQDTLVMLKHRITVCWGLIEHGCVHSRSHLTTHRSKDGLHCCLLQRLWSYSSFLLPNCPSAYTPHTSMFLAILLKPLTQTSSQVYQMNQAHTHCGFIFVQDLIIFAHSYTEYDGRYIFKTVNPLFPFWPLSSHVEQPAKNEGERAMWSKKFARNNQSKVDTDFFAISTEGEIDFVLPLRQSEHEIRFTVYCLWSFSFNCFWFWSCILISCPNNKQTTGKAAETKQLQNSEKVTAQRTKLRGEGETLPRKSFWFLYSVGLHDLLLFERDREKTDSLSGKGSAFEERSRER